MAFNSVGIFHAKSEVMKMDEFSCLARGVSTRDQGNKVPNKTKENFPSLREISMLKSHELKRIGGDSTSTITSASRGNEGIFQNLWQN